MTPREQLRPHVHTFDFNSVASTSDFARAARAESTLASFRARGAAMQNPQDSLESRKLQFSARRAIHPARDLRMFTIVRDGDLFHSHAGRAEERPAPILLHRFARPLYFLAMGSSWIVLVLILGWSAVQAIVSAAAKKQEKKRQQELAERKRQVQQGGVATVSGAGAGTRTGAVSGQSVGGPGSIITPRAANKPATTRDDLAARRQAQLEELRRRRMQQASGSAGRSAAVTRVPPGKSAGKTSASGSAPQFSRSKLPTVQPIPGRGAKQQAIRPSAKKVPPKTLRQKAKLESASRPVVSDVLTRGQIGSGTVAVNLGTPIGAGATTARDDRKKEASATVNAAKSRIGRVKALREMIIMKEIFDSPMALRESPSGTT